VPGILATAKRLAPPTLAEGFDRLFEVEVAGEGEFRVREVRTEGSTPGGGETSTPGAA